MQKRQLWILNAALAVFAVLLVVRLAGDWRRGNERYWILEERSQVAGALPVVPVSQQTPAAVGDIIAKNIFSPDRNNNRAQVSQSQPPLPVAIGTMRLGEGYEALMSEGGAPGAARFHRVKQGAQIGGYTVVEIRDEAVVVDYQGQRTEINVYQSAQSVARTAAAPVAAAPAASPVVETSGSTTATATQSPPNTFPPSTTASTSPVANAASSAVAQPQQVTVTIEGNRKRYERSTAFGPQVWYEDIK
jgi:type IV secretory pathway VirJ component